MQDDAPPPAPIDLVVHPMRCSAMMGCQSIFRCHCRFGNGVYMRKTERCHRLSRHKLRARAPPPAPPIDKKKKWLVNYYGRGSDKFDLRPAHLARAGDEVVGESTVAGWLAGKKKPMRGEGEVVGSSPLIRPFPGKRRYTKRRQMKRAMSCGFAGTEEEYIAATGYGLDRSPVGSSTAAGARRSGQVHTIMEDMQSMTRETSRKGRKEAVVINLCSDEEN